MDDDLIVHVVRTALANAGLLRLTCVQAIHNPNRTQIWIRDDRTKGSARWCIIEVQGSMLLIENGHPPHDKINLADPDSVKDLSNCIDAALRTTKLFATPDVSD